MVIKPIETRYGGYRFRSRLEARWAVFFDHCRVRYVYEQQGFNLPSGNYLPDFWIPDYQNFVEVKPLDLLPTRNFEFTGDQYTAPYGTLPIDDNLPHDLQLAWELHRATGKWVMVVFGDPYDVIRDATAVDVGRRGMLANTVGFFDLFAASLYAAADAARAARFEYGENG